MPAYLFGVLAAGWMGWAAPFFLIKREGAQAQTVDRRARWGIVIQGIGFAILWMSNQNP